MKSYINMARSIIHWDGSLVIRGIFLIKVFILGASMNMNTYGQKPVVQNLSYQDGMLTARVEIRHSIFLDRVVHFEKSDSLDTSWTFLDSDSFDPSEVSFSAEIGPMEESGIFRFVPVMDLVRSRESEFENISGFEFPVKYYHSGGRKLRIAYLDVGEGDPIVFFHGVQTWSYCWVEYINTIVSKGYRVIAVDLLGFGRSDKMVGHKNYTKEGIQELLGELIFEHLKLKNLILVGASFSSDLAARLAVDNPEMVEGMVAICPTFHDGTNEGLNSNFELNYLVALSNIDSEISQFIEFQIIRQLSEEEKNAYNAPFAERWFKDGVLAISGSLEPTSQDHPSALNQREYWEKFRDWEKPLVVISTTHPVQSDWPVKYRQIPGAAGQPHLHFTAETPLPELDFADEVLNTITDFLDGL